MSDNKIVSFAMFEEDDSSFNAGGMGGYEFIPENINCGDGYLVVGYDFKRENARLYVHIADLTGQLHSLPVHPNYSYALLSPGNDEALAIGENLNPIYFLDGMPVAFDTTLGGPSDDDEDKAYYTPVYLKQGTFTLCEGTTVTSKAQIFSGNKTFNNTVTIGESTTLNSTLSVGDDATFSKNVAITDNISVGGTAIISDCATFENEIILSGTTDSASQITFEKNGASFFSASNAAGYFAFIPKGKNTNTSNADLIIDDGVVYPGSNDNVNLGSSTNKWKNIYATSFNGDLVGNASSANKLNGVAAGSQTIPVYFSDGLPVQCTPEGVFSAFSKSASDTSTNTLSLTICGFNRIATIGAATSTTAGLLSATTQTIGGAKTFSNDVTFNKKVSLLDTIVIDATSYGTSLPTSGVEGQVFFLLID